MGPGRIAVDFRVNGQPMGSCLTEAADAPGRVLFWNIGSDVPLAKVTVVKNEQDYYVSRGEHIGLCRIVDYERQQPEDRYYLRVELTDGRMAWTSPCWVRTRE
jgi:hypothetical protein